MKVLALEASGETLLCLCRLLVVVDILWTHCSSPVVASLLDLTGHQWSVGHRVATAAQSMPLWPCFLLCPS